MPTKSSAKAKTTASSPVKPKTTTATAKKDNTLKIVLIVVGVITGLLLIGGILTTIFVGSVFKKAAKNVSVDSQSGTVNVRSEDGSASIGGEAKIPSDFPKDVPVYPGSKVTFAVKTEGKNFSVAVLTKDDVAKVMDYYKRELAAKGWNSTDDSLEITFEGGSSKSYSKENRVILVTVGTEESSQSSGQTIVTLTVTER